MGSQEEAETGHLTQSSHRGIPYHSMSCPVYKLWGVTRKAQIAAQVRLGIGRWVVSDCIAHHLCLLFSFPFPFPHLVLYSLPLLFPLSLLLLVVAVVVLCYTLVTGLFLSQPVRVTFFEFSSPSCQELGGSTEGVSKQLHGSLLAVLKPQEEFFTLSH